MDSVVPNISTKRRVALVFTVLVVALSWLGNLDKHSEAYLDQALVAGGLVYATARGINAAVSVMQGTEITPAVATFTVGEVLDPVNDLIERFSGVLLLALGSLALQKILLGIFSHYGFSLLVTAIAALVVLTCVYAPAARWFRPALRLLLFTVVIRFALTLVVIASAAVNHVFLEQADTVRHAEMTRLEGELRSLNKATPGAPSAEEIAEASTALEALRKLQAGQQEQAEQLGRQLGQLNDELDAMRSTVPLTCRLNPWCDEGDRINAKKLEIFAKETELGGVEAALDTTASRMAEKRDFLTCARQQQAGESCSLLESAYSWVSPSAWAERFAAMGDRVDEYAGNIISLLVSFLARTILIPLLFLYSLLQVYRMGLRQLATKIQVS